MAAKSASLMYDAGSRDCAGVGVRDRPRLPAGGAGGIGVALSLLPAALDLGAGAAEGRMRVQAFQPAVRSNQFSIGFLL